MSIESDLLARICAEPTDVETRVVYADRLIDKDDPRGAFIAQQCELAKLDVFDKRYAPILASVRRLEAAHALKWLSELFTRAKIREEGYRSVRWLLRPIFANGFLRRIAFRPEDIAKHWKWLRAREPALGVELVVGEHLPEEFRELIEPKSFEVLKISPDGWFTSNSVGDVLAWGMPKLREIDLSRCDLGATGCKLLANVETDLADTFDGWRAPPPFAQGQVERLELHGCSITDAGARILFEAESLAGLRDLGIGGCKLRTKATIEALRDAPAMAGLVRLSLAGNNDLQGHLGALAGWSALPNLERIALPQVISASELQALFPKPSSKLRELDLTSAKDLVKTPAPVFEVATALTHLDIGSSSIGDAGFAQLLATKSMHSLIELEVNGCSLSDKAVTALVKSKLRRLVTLDLSSNKLTDAGLATLAEWPGLELITHLRLGNNRKITAEGYAALIGASSLAPVSLDVGKVADKALIARLRERFGDALVVGE